MTRTTPNTPRSRKTPFLVAVIGGSGAGKTWLADKLAARLGSKATRLSLDAFYRDRSHLSPARRARLNFDRPAAIDWPEFLRALRDLRAGKATTIPQYDFATHCRSRKSKSIRPKPAIIVDGLWLAHRPALRSLFDLVLFLDCPATIRLKRRLARDLANRGRSRESVRAQFLATVQPMHRRFVEPQRAWAHAVLRNCGKPEIDRLARRIGASL